MAGVLSGLFFPWAWTMSDHGEYLFALIGTALAVGLAFLVIYGWRGFPEQPPWLTRTLKVVVWVSALGWGAVQAFVIYRNKGDKPWTNFRASDFVTARSYFSLVVLVSWKWLVVLGVGALGYAVGRFTKPAITTDREVVKTQSSDAPSSVQFLAENDRTAIADRVKLIGISYNPNFAKGYIDFTLAVYNDSLFDVVLELSIKGDDLRFSPDWEGFHYELKSVARGSIECPKRDGCLFTLRQPLTDGEMKQFQDDYERVVDFSALDITIKGKDESEDIQSRSLKSDKYVQTKRGMWRVGDKMEALFVLARQKFEPVEALADKPLDQPLALPAPDSAPVPVKQSFVNKTPRQLFELYEGRTIAQGDLLMADYKGDHIRVTARHNDSIPDGSGITAILFADHGGYHDMINARFNGQQREVRRLSPGEMVTLSGVISDVQNGQQLYLHDCELLEGVPDELLDRVHTAESVAISAGVAASAADSKAESAAMRPASTSAEENLKPQPNIVMLGDPRLTLVTHNAEFLFSEELKAVADGRWGIVVEFQNRRDGEEIKSLGAVRSELTFTNQAGTQSYTINPGFWFGPNNAEVNFERGDIHRLFIGFMMYLPEANEPYISTIDRRFTPPEPLSFSPQDSISVRITLFTQTRHRFHKDCEIELTPKLRITKPFV